MSDPFTTHWDAVIIGTGMGGGTIGRALAEAGQKVLFVEKGPPGHSQAVHRLSEIFVPEARLSRGLWPDPLHVTLDGAPLSLYAPLGAGVGGSSVFYAGTLERPERHDLDDSPTRPHPTGGWPVSFDSFAPWYDLASKLYNLCGTPDPLSKEPVRLGAPPPQNAMEQSLHLSLREAGLHPYHAHSALAPGDMATRPRSGLLDARSAGVEPACATGNAHVLSRASVIRILGQSDRVSGLEVSIGQERKILTGARYILAAGALGAPHLLLRSACEAWPKGAANSSGLVGRHLMFHFNEMFALWPRRGTRDAGASKTLALRDLYHNGDARFGMVQSMGVRASYGEIVHYLSRLVSQTALHKIPGQSLGVRLAASIAVRAFGTAQICVGLLEDLPYAENRVLFDPSNPDALRITYKIAPELKARRRAFRRAIYRALKGHRRVFLSRLPEPNYGHPCGTLRFGDDPSRSVLRPDCRAHDLRNLWAVDASFMPTSMGVNPSLTIAANALRVADHLKQEPLP